MNIYQKLVEVRKQVEFMLKDTSGTGIPYKYTKGSDLILKIRPKMDELGLLLYPEVTDRNITEFESENKDGKKIKNFTVELTLNMVWVNSDNPEEQLTVPFAGMATQTDIAKAFGSALTYTERYFLFKFFNIATDKDDPDSNKNEPKNATSSTPIKDSKKESEYKCAGCGTGITKQVNDYSTKKFSEPLCFNCQKEL